LIAVFGQLTAQLFTLFFSHQILFENRKVGDVDNDCLPLIDSTDVPIAKKLLEALLLIQVQEVGLLL
jgi:hypothetical protein